jgi:hypothetical protein
LRILGRERESRCHGAHMATLLIDESARRRARVIGGKAWA